MKPETRTTRELVYGINRRNVELIYAHNPRHLYPLADDKHRCKTHLQAHGIPVPETLALCRGLFEVDSTLARLREDQDFVVKPANGSGGDGILVLRARVAGGWQGGRDRVVSDRALRQHLANLVFGAHSKELEDKALVERRLQPHPMFTQLWSDGVCDLRVITLRAQPVMAMIRVPTHRSAGRANLHQGGIGVAVDLQTGRTTAARIAGQAISHHPENGTPLVGLQVPDFDQVLQVAVQTACCVPLGYLGIDLVIDEQRGPLVLEINARPGLEIQNVTGVGLGRALLEPSR